MVGEIDLWGGGLLGAGARFVVALGVLVGLALGGAWLVVATDRWSGGNPVLLLFLAVVLSGALITGSFWTAHDLEPSTTLIVAWTLSWAAVVLGGLTLGVVTWLWSDQQVLHDRGVVVAGVVGGHWTSGSGAGIDPGPFFFYDVRGSDDSSWTFRTETAGERPDVGTPITLTVDPRDEVRPQRGARPPARNWVVATVARDCVLAGSLGLAAAAAVPRRRSPDPMTVSSESTHEGPAPRGS
ncbi:hypothetical protein [Streptomyces sp. NPDC020817]|uniref:hypothetical protein n=1 Tax=Streptomyces sp. NPDC020817 TaxID=3365095 RepID=UPI003797AABC